MANPLQGFDKFYKKPKMILLGEIMANNKGQIHEGHRTRLLENVTASGLENLSEIQQLEFLLTLAIPRKDTNPISHALLDAFGGIANVLDADPTIIAKTGIVGLRTAKIITALHGVHKCYQKSRLSQKAKLNNNAIVNEYCKKFLASKPKEELFLFCLDEKQQLISVECIKKGDAHSIQFELKDINEAIVRSSASSVFLAHSHPNLNPSPSNADIKTTKIILNFLDMLHIPLLDHVIVAGEEVFSFFSKQFVTKV